jgi:hypothetical protein
MALRGIVVETPGREQVRFVEAVRVAASRTNWVIGTAAEARWEAQGGDESQDALTAENESQRRFQSIGSR